MKSQLAAFSATFFYVKRYSSRVTRLLAPSQVFVSQLKLSHGSVPKSGLKLLQMFSNDRLQCQHKPTSTFCVLHLRLWCCTDELRSKTSPLWSPLESTSRWLLFGWSGELSERGFVCQREAVSATYALQCCNKTAEFELSELVPVVRIWLARVNKYCGPC